MPIKTRPPKWEFTVSITSGAPLVGTQGGMVMPSKVVLTSYATKCKVVVSGRLSGAPNWNNQTLRAVAFNISGYDQYQKPPEWLVALLQEHAFPKIEV